MNFNSLPWSTAQLKDQHYKYYHDHFRNFAPLETRTGIPRNVKDLVYGMLDPNPDTRVTIAGIVGSEWFKGICVCVGGECVVDKAVTYSHGL